MALVDLAGHSNGRPVALADISGRQEISLSYLEQLFAKLRRAGLVKSVRGPGGGYLLARTAEDTRISDAIMAVDEPIRATRCKPNSGTGCHTDKSRCLTHDLWEELSHQIHLFLNSVSLADVCEKRVLGRSGSVAKTDGIESNGATPPTNGVGNGANGAGAVLDGAVPAAAAE
jgi:Rrf2 family iron-sulfur cluster assembly transcriptional regulator